MFKVQTITRAVILSSVICSLASLNSSAIASESVQNRKEMPISVAMTKSLTNENNAETGILNKQTVKSTNLALATNIKPVNNVTKPAKVAKAKISYKTFQQKAGQPAHAAVFINNREVIRYTASVDGYTPEKRAKILADRLQYFVNKKGDPNDILPGMKNGIPICRANGQLLFTINSNSAKAQKIPLSTLSLKWINNIRQALGAPVIVRDYTRIASRGGVSTSFSREIIGSSEVGMASWYGGVFHGRKSADGTRFSTYEFTAAHKTLPFGTVVKVTNLKNGKFCYVRISDRGPFVRGRVIDLSKAAADHLNMLSSGVAKVKVEKIVEF